MEDEALIRLSEKNALINEGYNVIAVPNGAKAIEAMRNGNAIDLILMDINLGKGMDGTEAASIILRDHDIPVVFLSCHTEKDIVAKTEKITSYGYVAKDASITVLDASVKMAFKLHKAHVELKEKEERLRENERRFQTFLDTLSNVAIHGFGPHGTVTYWNKANESVFGYGRDEAVGRNVLELIVPPGSWNDVKKWVDEEARTGVVPPPSEWLLKKKDGSRVPVLASHTAVHRPGRELEHFVVNVDLTASRQTENELKRFKTIADSSGEAIAITNPDGRFLYINNAHERLFQRSLAEARSLNYRDYCTPESVDVLNRIVAPALARGESWEGELEAFDANGRRFPLCQRAGAVFNEKGKMLYAFGFMHDITENKKMAEALKESKERYMAIFHESPIAIEYYDAQGRLEMVNKACVELFGVVDDKEIKGFQLFNDPNLPADTKSRLQRGETIRIEYDFDYDLVKEWKLYRTGKEGICRIDCMIAPLITEGETIGYVVQIQDITERQRAEKALKESEEKYRHLFETESDALFLVDKETGTILEVNDAACSLYGYTREEMVRMKNVDVSAEPERTEEATKDLRIRIPIRFHKKKDGTLLPVDISAGLFTFRGRQVVLAAVRDITERRTAEEQIRASLTENKLLLKEIHHRTKNNLAIIASILRLQSKTLDDDRARTILDECSLRVDTMGRLHTRLYQSKVISHIEFSTFMKELVDDLSKTYGVGGRMEIHIAADEVRLNVDVAMPLSLILNELITNAVKYAFPDNLSGKIEIILKRTGKTLTLTIADNGVGFPRDIDFRNTESLGMELVVALVEQIRGSIELDNRDGTKFTVTFGIPD